MARRPKDIQKIHDRLNLARREIRKAVERFAEVPDPLEGHRIEAVRQAREVRDAADRAVKALSQ